MNSNMVVYLTTNKWYGPKHDGSNDTHHFNPTPSQEVTLAKNGLTPVPRTVKSQDNTPMAITSAIKVLRKNPEGKTGMESPINFEGLCDSMDEENLTNFEGLCDTEDWMREFETQVDSEVPHPLLEEPTLKEPGKKFLEAKEYDGDQRNVVTLKANHVKCEAHALMYLFTFCA
jgi:hypothetical protein